MYPVMFFALYDSIYNCFKYNVKVSFTKIIKYYYLGHFDFYGEMLLWWYTYFVSYSQVLKSMGTFYLGSFIHLSNAVYLPISFPQNVIHHVVALT